MLTERPLDFVDARGRPFLCAHPTPRGHGHPPQLFIYQPALEQVLRDGVARHPNVEVLLRHECLRLRQDAGGVELTVVGTADDSVHRLRASYVIAADGGSSLIRSQLNVGYEGRTYEDRWVVIDTEMIKPWPDHDRLRFHCDPARPAVDCPTPLGHHRWEFPILPGDDETHLTTDEAVYALVARYGISRDSIRSLRATVYSHHVRFAARFRVGRVFLAGDAAHAMPPWIGDELGLERAHLVGNSYGGACALRLALDTPGRVDRMVLMGPGGIGTTRSLPTAGLNNLVNYYGGDGPSRLKLETFIRQYLVFNAADVPDSASDERYRASIDPEVMAAPPLRRPSGPNALRTLWKMDFTRDRRLDRLPVPTLVLWGAEDRVNRPGGGCMLADRMPDCDLYVVANTGHWVQFERAELFDRLCADFLAGRR
ncbi:hypothetical protein QF035_009716 [Streptomyces umbrinus]|uniref:Uncharacterized protein n=1 Tax=Streptomyces umbrinus TaxID=67370 RepID=A0ABU0T8J3_9ACTN|nr:hypothetical protein [Streptomyces umbrinus]